ncbi:extracellular metalloprotease [Bisporella sp. PMI_857]|nr:extracellular metalloprotease [Bisporella sp. PMI_857]
MVRLTTLASGLALCLPSAFAHPSTADRATGGKFGCGVQPTEQFITASRNLAAKEAKSPFHTLGKAYSNASTITIDTYFHVVARSKSLSGGYVPPEQLESQLAVLNDNFAPYGFEFNLVSTDYTINRRWASDGNELAMKKALRKGDYKSLNIYFLYNLDDAFGYCYFPTTVEEESDEFYIDGCSILYTTVPGGSATNYNEGKTVTHEVGHWFGLLHTFGSDSCEGSGDEIADTPQQFSASQGCPVGRDSCTELEGLDPIHNYMDYSYDSCYEEFTPNQNTRMLSMYNEYRA